MLQLFFDLCCFKFEGCEFFLKLRDLLALLLRASGLRITLFFQLQYPFLFLLDQLFNGIFSLLLVSFKLIKLLFQLLLIVEVKLSLVPQGR